MRQPLGEVLGTACATWAIGLPLALALIYFGADVLIWLLDLLPDV